MLAPVSLRARRDALGTIANLEVAAGQMKTSRGSPGVYRAVARDAGGESLRPTLIERQGGCSPSLRGCRVDTWRASDGVLSLEITTVAHRGSALSALCGNAVGRVRLP